MSVSGPLRRRSSLLEIRANLDTGAWLKLLLFAFFVLTRAVHPLVIDLSKEGGKMLYAKNTVVVTAKVSIVLLMNVWAFLAGGVWGVRQCWQPRCLVIFGMLGMVYALGDFLEMLSMAKLGGGVYQILLQSKLLITALMLWWLKGTRQTPLQAHVLLAMFLAMSSFVISDMDESSSSGGSLPTFAVICVMLKVAVSCYCAVLAEKYLKSFKHMPFYAKISALSTTWALASAILCFATERKVLADGFYSHWTMATCFVVVSFVVKTLSTQYLLQKLDSVQKNIGEALSVIVIYASQVWLPSFDKSFNLGVFLLAILVVALVKTYLLSTPAPAMKADMAKQKSAKRVNIVKLNPDGTQLMRTLGRNTLRCEVEEALPDGVFYGMLGGVHPVCGNTSPASSRQCELMMIGEPASSTPLTDSCSKLPHMPQQSLTVLGHIRGKLPKESLTAKRFEQDVECATAGIAGLVEAD